MLLVLTLIAAVAVDMIGDKTQTRPDVVRAGSTSEVVFSLRTKMDRDRRMTANALWGACQGTVDSRVVDPGVVRLDETTFRITLAPELGHHARTRLTGCIEDATLDRVVANVHRITSSE